ncbi:MAG: relaxase domain-containing protein [Deltaproteobacteria bacterium]|nr:relaxase domain-containing protein [Deltaproteobacteria bacterium]
MGPVAISGSSAKNYYIEKDPILNPEGNGKNAKWYGGGLAELRLKEGDRVMAKDFECIVGGKNLDGCQLVQLTHSNSKRTEHRAGVDFTFDDPKSVSICEHVLHYKADVIQNARQAALEKAISHIDQNYIYYRQTVNGVTTMRQAPGQGIIAAFGHSLSRKNDPQSHTHVIISNMIKCPDGQIRALSNEMIFKDQKYLTSMYHSEMAYSLARNGFAIEARGKGLYEIGGVDQKVIDQFSKRSSQIDKAVNALRETYPKACEAELRKMATLETRAAKDKNITPDQLSKSWSQQINNNLYISKDQLVKSVEAAFDRQEAQETGKAPMTAQECVKAAVRDLQTYESTFRDKDVLTHAMSLFTGNCRETDISGAFSEARKTGHIQQIAQKDFKSGLSEKVYSTPEMIKTEQQILCNPKVIHGQCEREAKTSNCYELKHEFGHSHDKADDFKIKREFYIEREGSGRDYCRETDYGLSKQAEIEIGS